jgi:hypothetical protein
MGAIEKLEWAWRELMAVTGRAPTRIKCGRRFLDAFADEARATAASIRVKLPDSVKVRLDGRQPPPDMLFKGIRLELSVFLDDDEAEVFK